MPDRWRKVALKEITSKIGSGATPRGGKTVYIVDGVSFIRSQNVHDNHFSRDGLALESTIRERLGELTRD